MKSFAINCSVPQGSVVGPLKFIAYTEDLPLVVEEHNVDPYLYAGDGQLNDHLLLSDVGTTIPKWRTVWMCKTSMIPNVFN